MLFFICISFTNWELIVIITEVTMRCKNCGYVNEDNVSRCIKCNAELGGTTNNGNPEQHYSPTQNEEYQPARTMHEPSGSVHHAEHDTPKRQRPEPFNHGAFEASQPGVQIPHGGTVNPWAQKQGAKCWLKSMDYKPSINNHPGYGSLVRCNGDEFELTRNNTNPADNTISSHQALLTHDASGWYIEDTSTYHSTAIIVSRRTKLEEGDTIVLGSTRFIFTEEEPPTYS